MSKWRKIGTYTESKSVNESKFNINRKQAQMILDLKSDELKKMRFLAMLDIDKDELKILAKQDPSIVKAIGKQGGSFRTSMVRKRANEEVELDEKEIKYDGKGPVKMSKKEYDKINKFRKGSIRGDLYVMATNPKGFNVLVPVIFEEVEIQENFSAGMMDKLKKSYEPLRGKKISPSEGKKLMGIMDKVDKNKNALIQLFKADIPFVSQLASTRLITKHNMKGKDINKLKEDAPTNSVASGGVDMNPTGLSKKKRDLDGRTKEYKIHANKLTAQREKRLKKKEMIKGSFVKEVVESISKFAREEFIAEDNVDILRDIVKRKQAQNIKLKDGNLKIDMTSANAIMKNLVDAPPALVKTATRQRVVTIINKGNKAQFMKLVSMLFR